MLYLTYGHTLTHGYHRHTATHPYTQSQTGTNVYTHIYSYINTPTTSLQTNAHSHHGYTLIL